MADTPQTLASIAGALPQFYRDPVVKQINRRSVLLRIIPVLAGMGKNVAFDVEGDGMVAENFSDGDDASSFGSDALSPTGLGWGLHRANFRVTDVAAAAARTSGQPKGLVRLMGRNFVSAAAKLASFVNGACFTGTGAGNSIVGLTTALRDDNVYAGIDRTIAGNAYWRANFVDSGGDPLSLAMLREDICDTIYRACGGQPDAAFCDPTTYTKIGGLFEETRRRVQIITEITTARGRVVLDGSIGAIEVEGCVFFKDKDCPAGEIHYLNTEAVSVEYLPQDDDETLAEASEMMALDDGYGPIPLGMKCLPLGRKGSARPFTSQIFAQLKVTQPNACGRRTNFT